MAIKRCSILRNNSLSTRFPKLLTSLHRFLFSGSMVAPIGGSQPWHYRRSQGNILGVKSSGARLSHTLEGAQSSVTVPAGPVGSESPCGEQLIRQGLGQIIVLVRRGFRIIADIYLQQEIPQHFGIDLGIGSPLLAELGWQIEARVGGTLCHPSALAATRTCDL
jgi:hypothetical protein